MAEASLRMSAKLPLTTRPKVLRRCCLPTLYLTKNEATPVENFLMPKPGRVSSNTCVSLTPSGTSSLAAKASMPSFRVSLNFILLPFPQVTERGRYRHYCWVLLTRSQSDRACSTAKGRVTSLNAHFCSLLLMTAHIHGT